MSDALAAQAEARIADLLPDGYIALGFVVSIKALDRDGAVCLINTRTSEVCAWEALGMVEAAGEDIRAALRQREAPE